MATRENLTIDFDDLLGAEVSRISARLMTNLPSGAAVMDETNKTVNLGSGKVAVGQDGKATLPLILTNSTDLNIAANTLQYRILAEATVGGDRVKFDSGWFAFTAAADITELDLDQPALTPSGAGSGSSSLTVVDGGTDTLPASPTAGLLVGRTYTETTTVPTTLTPVTLPPGDYVWRWTGLVWDYRLIDGWQHTTETVAPTAGTLNTVATETTIALDVDGAMDDTGLHATPYSFRISDDDGATWSAWTAWQAGATHTYTDLTSSTDYSLQHRVRDVFGNVKEGLAVDTTTAALYSWATLSNWAFTAADGTDLNGLAPTTGSGTLVTLPAASDPGATPPIYVNVMGNQGHFRAAGASSDLKLTEPVAHDGIGIEVDVDIHSTADIRFLAGTNPAGTNYMGFYISAAGAITAHHYAAGSTTYAAEPGAPTVVPDTATIRAEFSKNTDGSCTGRLYVDGVLYGSILSSGWTWQGNGARLHVTSNQQDSYIDNLKVLGGTVV